MSNLKRAFGSNNTILYTWQRPFTLTITSESTEPGILFCVSIHSIHCSMMEEGSVELSVNNCNVTMTNYTIESHQDMLYRIEVFPRINLEEGLQLNRTYAKEHQGIITFNY